MGPFSFVLRLTWAKSLLPGYAMNTDVFAGLEAWLDLAPP